MSWSAVAAAPPQKLVQGKVSHQEISFTLPGEGWWKISELGFNRTHGPGRFSTVSIWPVDPYLESRYWTSASHVKAYFSMERHQTRDPGVHWSNFNESEREIDGRRYPALTFEISHDGDDIRGEGVFLMCFPNDFPLRQRFYVVMWIDYHPPEESGAEPSGIDALMRSLSCGSFVSPGVLMLLTVEAAPAEWPAANLNARTLAKKFAKTTDKKRSYRSELAVIDRANSELQSKDFLTLHWAMDYLAPDRYHVMQMGWEQQGHEYVYDEWIDLKAEHFDNAGFWAKLKKSDATDIRTRIGQSLRADDLVKLLASTAPATLTEHHFRGRRYHAFLFPLDPASSLVCFPVKYSSVVDGPFNVRIWVDADTGLLAKADITGAAMKSDGKPATMEIVRVFGQWDQNFAINAPVMNLTSR